MVALFMKPSRPYEIVSPEELSSCLANTLSWLSDLGIPSKHGDRVNVAFETAQRLDRFVSKYKTTGQMPDENPPDAQALVEALEFCDIYRAFNDAQVENALIQKLSIISSGPAELLSENLRNSSARNVMFELAIAAEWKRKGLNVSVGDPDLRLDLEDAAFLVECKRPFRDHSARANIKDAAKQISAYFTKEEPREFGIIAISLSRILNPGNIASFAPLELRRQAVDEEIVRLRRLHPEWRRVEFHPRTAALLFNARMPWLGKGKVDYVSVSQFMRAAQSAESGYQILRKHFPHATEAPTLPY
jgi:hypothetical protein